MVVDLTQVISKVDRHLKENLSCGEGLAPDRFREGICQFRLCQGREGRSDRSFSRGHVVRQALPGEIACRELGVAIPHVARTAQDRAYVVLEVPAHMHGQRPCGVGSPRRQAPDQLLVWVRFEFTSQTLEFAQQEATDLGRQGGEHIGS